MLCLVEAWNPAKNSQAWALVHSIGQTEETTVTVFNSPYNPDDPLNGQECTVLDSRTVRCNDTILTVKFTSGLVLEVWAEEVQEV